MYSFKNDYSEGAHPNLLNILVQTNLIQEEGYGYDSLSFSVYLYFLMGTDYMKKDSCYFVQCPVC